MKKSFIIYNREAYSDYMSTENGYILLSNDEKALNEGYVPFEPKQVALYQKFIPFDQVTRRYSIYDRALYKGVEYDIVGRKKGDEHFTAPDGYVQILVRGEEFLWENDLAEGAYLLDDKYGDLLFCSGKIPLDEVTIVRYRENLPIE